MLFATHLENTTMEINEDISSILRAAKAELLYPGLNPTPVADIANQLSTIADGIDLSKALDEIETAGISDQYFKIHARTLADLHPNKLVRALANQLLKYQSVD